MEEKNNVFKYLFIVFLILTCVLGGFIVYDKFIDKPNSDIQNNNNNDVQDNTNNNDSNSVEDNNNNDNSNNQVDDNSSNDNNSNIQNSKNDIEKLKEILKQQAFLNVDQSVENYFEGYLNPIVEVMVKNGASISVKQVKDLTEEDMARIICLISPAKITSIYPYNTRDIENIYQDNEVKEYVKKYFNKDNYSFSNFKKYNETDSDAKIVLNSDKSLTCNSISVSRTIEVTDVIYKENTGKILVYIDIIYPGQAVASNIGITGTIELKYNDGNFNIVNLDFTNVLD